MNNKVINYRISKAEEAFDLARVAIEKGYWNSAASRLYYTCFYFVTALLAKDDIQTYTHNGVKAVFGLQYIKEGKVEAKWGKLLAILFDKRQIGDYGDFPVLTSEQIIPLFKEVEEFIPIIRQILEQPL